MTAMVTCPVCEGDGKNPFGHNAENPLCKCCFGDGEVTAKKLETLATIKGEITRILKEKGYERA